MYYQKRKKTLKSCLSLSISRKIQALLYFELLGLLTYKIVYIFFPKSTKLSIRFEILSFLDEFFRRVFVLLMMKTNELNGRIKNRLLSVADLVSCSFFIYFSVEIFGFYCRSFLWCLLLSSVVRVVLDFSL